MIKLNIEQMKNTQLQAGEVLIMSLCKDAEGFKKKYSDLPRFIQLNQTAHEAIYGPVVPYFDIEIPANDLSEHKETYLKLRSTLEDSYPNSDIYIFDNSRKSVVDKDKKKGPYKLSFHAIIRGAGYYSCGKDLECAIPESVWNFPGLDKGIYMEASSRKLFRLPYCRPDGEREGKGLRRIEVEDDEIVYSSLAVDRNIFPLFCVTNVGEEKHIPVDRTKTLRVEKKREEKEREEKYEEKKYPPPTQEDIERLVKMLKDSRTDDRSEWRDCIFVLRLIFDEYKIPTIDIAHEFSKRSEKYEETGVNQLYWSADSTKANAVGVGSLFQWAKDDNPVEYEKFKREKKNANEIVEDEVKETYFEDYEDLIIEKGDNLTVRDVELYMLGCLVKVKSGAWFKRSLDKINGNVEWIMSNDEPFTKRRELYPFSIPNPTYNPKVKGSKPMIVTNFDEVLTNLVSKPIFLRNNNLDKVGFKPYPGKISPWHKKMFNLFSGFGFEIDEKYDVSYCQKTLDHVYKVLANENQQFCSDILMWLADLFQNPAEKSGVALVFLSLPGAGKNVFWNFVRRQMLPKLSKQLPSVERLVQKHNDANMGKMLIVLNEAQKLKDFRGDNDKLKNLITEPELEVEPKGLKPFSIDDYCRFVFLSNNPNPVVSDKDERRYAEYDCSNKYIDNDDYFNPLRAEMKDPRCAVALYNYLMQIKIDYKRLIKLPRIMASDNRKLRWEKSVIHFLIDVAKKETLPYAWDQKDNMRIHDDDLYENYTNWCGKNREQKVMKKNNFLDKIYTANVQAGAESGLGMIKSRPKINGVQKQGFKTSLEELRNKLCTYTKTNIVWVVEAVDDDEE